MDTKKVFEETGKIGNEIKRLGKQLEKVNAQCFEMMELCPHEVVFKYTDNYPRKLLIDGTYFCPACGKSVRCIQKEQLQESPFKDLKVIPLSNLSLIGTKEILYAIRNEVYQNMDLYYNREVSVEKLADKMESILEDKQNRYKGPTLTLKK